MAKVLCMEVGTSTVRLAEVVKRGKSAEVTKIYVFDTPDDATKDGKVRVSDEVVSAIRQGIEDSGIKALDVYFVVESTKILFKQVEIPVVPKNKILETLKLSFSEHFPVDEKFYHVSYVHEKNFEKDGRKMMALDVFAVPNDLSESYYNLAVELGLNAKGLTDPSRSIISLFSDSFKTRNVAMVNINENTSTLTLTVDGDMVFNKTIPYGVSGIIRQVMNSPLSKDDISVTDAIEHLSTQSIVMKQMPAGINSPDSEEEKVKYNATQAAVSLAKNIEAAYTAFLLKEKIIIQEFYLSGFGAGFDGLSQLLASSFEHTVAVFQQEGNLKINPTAATEELLISCYPCIGAVLDKANFFTPEEQAGGEIAHRRKVDKMFVFGGALAFLACFGYGAYSWLQSNLAYQDVYDNNVLLSKRVQDLRDLGVEIAYNEYMTAISYNEEVGNLYEQTKSGNEDMTVFLAELESLLPRSARVTSLNISPDIANATFVCEDKFVAAGVLHLLRNMETIHNMECSGVAEIERTEEITFTCQFSLKSTKDRLEEDKAEGEVTPDQPNDPDINTPTENLLSKITEVNTDKDLSKIKVNHVDIDIMNIDLGALSMYGFEPKDDSFKISNEAIVMAGVYYADVNNVELMLSKEPNGYFKAVAVESENVFFFNDLHVGMTMQDALAAIDNNNVFNDRGYVILKSESYTLVLKADFDGTVVESIYLIDNNRMFAESEPNVDPVAPLPEEN